MYDVLKSEWDNMPSQEILAQAIVPASYHEGVRLVPAAAALARLVIPGTSQDLMRLAYIQRY